MPTYEYRCNECGHEWEQEQKITAARERFCPKCKKEAAERLISRAAVVLKGTCWARDGYGNFSAKP